MLTLSLYLLKLKVAHVYFSVVASLGFKCDGNQVPSVECFFSVSAYQTASSVKSVLKKNTERLSLVVVCLE